MPSPIYSDIVDYALDRLQCNVVTDPRFGTAEILRHANQAYLDVYEASGGAQAAAAGSTLWTGGGSASGAADFTLPGSSGTEEIAQFLQVWASTTLGSTGDFNSDIPLDPADYEEIVALQSLGSALGSYAAPKKYAVIRRAKTVDTEDSRYDLYWWPSVAGFYFPAHYIKQFDPFDGGATDRADVDDIGGHDIPLLMALRMAPLAGRAELVPSIAVDLSERMKKFLERKLSARISASQDR